MITIADIPYSTKDEGCLINLYLPDNAKEVPFTTVVYYHGGGLVHGSRKMSGLGEAFAARGYALASVEYRMYPNHAYTSFIIDAADSAAWVKKNIHTYGGNGEVIVSGSSAGAYLTMMLCCDKQYLAGVGLTTHDFVAFVSDSSQMTTHFKVLAEEKGLNKKCERIDEASPLYHLSDETSFPALHLIYYTNDIVCRPEQNMLFYRSLLSWKPDAVVRLTELPGKHCSGSSSKNENGEYNYIVAMMDFLESIKK